MNPSKAFDSDHRASRGRHIWGFSALAVAMLLLGAMTWNTSNAHRARDTAERWHRHTLQVLLIAEQTRSAAHAALRGQRGYLITGDARFLTPFERAREEALALARQLSALVRDNPGQHQQTAALEARMTRYIDLLADTIELTRSGRGEAAIEVVKSGVGRSEIEAVLATIDRIVAQERRLLEERSQAKATATRVSDMADVALPLTAAIFLIAVGLAGYGASQARMRTLSAEKALRRAAITDELTGLLNRRAFLESLGTEITRVRRSNAPLSIALVDLDHFKQVNDRYGHHGGDAVLRRFARVARDTMRATDVIGRIGGEEFAVLMPETDHGEAGVAGERLRQAVAQGGFMLDDPARTVLPVTASIGVAHYIPGESADDFVRRADEALYAAKEAGRNRTRLAA